MTKTIKLFVIFLCLYACAARPIMIDIPAPPEQDDKAASILEEKMGSAGYYFLVLNFKLVDDIKTINRLNRIGARIAAFTERPHIRYKYIIIDSVYRNAFSLPDGYIIFTNSFIETFDQDEALASVIAHEIAHVTHKHSLSEYQRIMGKSISSIIGEKVFRSSTDIHYSLAYELQADQTGIRYLYRAGYDPHNFIQVLEQFKTVEKEDRERFEKEAGDGPAEKNRLTEQILPDHPATENRIVNTLNYIQEVEKTEEVKFDPEKYQF